MKKGVLAVLISICMLSTETMGTCFAATENTEISATMTEEGDFAHINEMQQDIEGEEVTKDGSDSDNNENLIRKMEDIGGEGLEESSENAEQEIVDGEKTERVETADEEETQGIEEVDETTAVGTETINEEPTTESENVNGEPTTKTETVNEESTTKTETINEEPTTKIVQENTTDFQESEEEMDRIASDALLDSHEDDPVAGELEKDDFETIEEWEEYLREHPQAYDMIMASPSPYSTGNVKAKLRYTVRGLPCENAIQKMYVGEKEIYVTQRYGKTTYLSRCEINKNTKEAVCKDFMTLQRFGHGQTLEYFEWNGKAYFWVGCKPNTAYDADWAMQIGRISYEPNTAIDYTQVCRLGTLNYANQTGVGLDGVKRVDAALSDDGSKLLIWVRSPENAMQYSWYDAAALNQILDERENEMVKYVSFLDNERLRQACLGTIVQKTASDWILPNDSFQGVEFTNQASVFTVGGGVGEKPRIALMELNGKQYKYTKLATVTNLSNLSTSEIEGIQLAGDCIYFGVCNHNVKATEQYIYSVYRNDIDTVKTAHTWNSGSIKTEQTCTTDEVKKYTCKYCGDTKEEISKKKTGHQYQYLSTVVATTKKNGYDAYICSRCSEKKTEIIYFPATIQLSAETYYYDGKKHQPKVTVKDTKGKTIAAENYVVSYSLGCVAAGSYKVSVRFQGKYSGEMEKTFRINKKSQTISAGNFTKTIGNAAFSIKAKLGKGDGKLSYKTSNSKIATVSSSGKATIKGVGKAEITITASETKEYKKATKKIYVTVNPKGTSISSLKSLYRGNATVQWKKNTSVTGYQIQYSKKSNFTASKTTTIGSKNTTKKTITGLTRGYRYYVRIRTYKTVSGVKYYSAWSGKKSVVVKR